MKCNFSKVIHSTNFDERRIKGLCLWCDDEYVLGHKCLLNKFFLVEVDVIEEDCSYEIITNVELRKKIIPIIDEVKEAIDVNELVDENHLISIISKVEKNPVGEVTAMVKLEVEYDQIFMHEMRRVATKQYKPMMLIVYATEKLTDNNNLVCLALIIKLKQKRLVAVYV
ncbi:hypothetical protein PTKIN_Ptkin02bG0128900 [Pterospermum kingtungense]